MTLDKMKRCARAGPLFRIAVLLCLVMSIVFWDSSQQMLATTALQGEERGEAQALFGSLCASCHGLNARGGERAPDIVTRPEVTRKSDAELADIVRAGRTSAGMPGFSSLGPEKIADLVAYLRELQARGKGTVLPGDPDRGKELFFGKAKCAQCHAMNGQGGFLGADLTSYAARLSVEEVAERITNPDKGLDPRKGTVEVALRDTGKLSGFVRNEDNFSLQLQTADGVFHLLNKTDIQTQIYTGKSGMPTNYASTLTTSEVNDIVSYLLRVANADGAQKKQPSADHDEY